MLLGRIQGTCVASRKIPALSGQRLLLVQPLDFDLQPDGPVLVAVDTVQADRGELVTYVKSREAANSLDDAFSAVDAAVVSIVDDLGMVMEDGRHLAWWRDAEGSR